MTHTAAHDTCRQRPSFRRDEAGVTAILFALMIVPVFGLIALAIDYGRIYGAKSQLQVAADAASAAGGKMLGQPRDLVGATVQAYLKANLGPEKKLPAYDLVIAPDDVALTLRIRDKVPTTLLGMFGFKRVDLAVESSAERPIPVIAVEPQGSEDGGAPAVFKLRPTDRAPTTAEMRDTEAAVREILRELEREGGSEEVSRILRALGQ
jgi:Putative Flp pilus-assembly TadE/G-like